MYTVRDRYSLKSIYLLIFLIYNYIIYNIIYIYYIYVNISMKEDILCSNARNYRKRETRRRGAGLEGGDPLRERGKSRFLTDTGHISRADVFV